MQSRFSRSQRTHRPVRNASQPEVRGAGADEGVFAPPTDVIVTAAGFEIRLEIPGAASDEVDITVEPDSQTVEIRGVRRPPVMDSGARYLNIEIQYGPFARIIALPDRVDADGAAATYHEGFLVVRLPKTRPPSPGRNVPIQSI